MTIKTKKWAEGEYYTIIDIPIDGIDTPVFVEIVKEYYDEPVWVSRIYELDESDPEFPRGELLMGADDVYDTKREVLESIEWLQKIGLMSSQYGLVLDTNAMEEWRRRR